MAYDQFYIPIEVNGEPGQSMLTGHKIDAVEAIYDFKPTHTPSSSYDSENVTMDLEEPTGNDIEYLETIPLLISEGFRSQLSIDSTQ